MITKKNISLADLLVLLKKYQGLMASWNKRLQNSIIQVDSEANYNKQVDYTWDECFKEVNKLRAYIVYLKTLRNNLSHDQIINSYKIAELKGQIVVLEPLRFVKKFQKHDGERYVDYDAYNPISKKEVDEIIEEHQSEISALQSSITHYNNTTFVDVTDY